MSPGRSGAPGPSGLTRSHSRRYERTVLPGFELHASEMLMAPKRRWAAVASRLPLTPEPDPHPASARVRVGSTTYVSSILPWRSCGSALPWVGDRHVDKTENAVGDLVAELTTIKSLVWGGDWNHALTGKEYAGSIGGRRAVTRALASLGLAAASRIDVTHEGKRLSDHDAYIVEVALQVQSAREA